MEVTEERPVARTAGRERRLLVAAVAALVLAVPAAAALAARPDGGAFRPVGAFGFRGWVPVGQEAHYVLDLPERDVRVAAVVPRVRRGSAAASLSVHLCRRSAATAANGAIHSLHGSAEPYCDDLVPVEGVALQAHVDGADRPPDYLVLSLVAHEQGRITIDGFDVAYVDGGRLRVARTSPQLDLRVRRP